LKYSWDGKFLLSIPKPEQTAFPLEKAVFVHDSVFIGHYPNLYGIDMYFFQLINESGQVVKSFDNPVQFNPAGPGNVLPNYAMRPFRMAEKTYVKETWNDTLYCLNEQYELVPHLVFDLGKYAMSKEKRIVPFRGNMEILDDVLDIPASQIPLVGIPGYVFLSFYARNISAFNVIFPEKQKKERASNLPVGYGIVRTLDSRIPVGIFDIVNQKTRLLDTDPVSRMTGLINDWDGGLSFWPKYCTSNNELIDIWQVYDMKEHLTDEYFAAHKIKNPQAHQKLKELLKNIREDDNPVIVIGKLKK
jgi:hypothetical protein